MYSLFVQLSCYSVKNENDDQTGLRLWEKGTMECVDVFSIKLLMDSVWFKTFNDFRIVDNDTI